MKSSGKKRMAKAVAIAAFIGLIAVLSVFGLTACGEIRYDHYVLTTATNADGTLTITECTVVKDKEVVIPAEYKGKKIKALGDGTKAVFGGCEFSTLKIEGGVEEIADKACLNWTPLVNLTLEEGLVRIGANAFSGCGALENITVPKSVTSIGEGAFEDTAWYKKQPNGKIIYVGSFLYEFKGNMPAGTEFGAGDIKEDTKYLSDFAFSGCIGLKSMVLPEKLQKIGASAFAGCTSLESIVIPTEVTEVGERAFEGCTLLETVVIPKGIGAIAPYMFYDCCGLTGVTVDAGITAIGESAFENCVGLREIVLPDTVVSIGDGAFKNCVLLNKLTANKVENIGAGAFYNDIELSQFALADTVVSIGDSAFDNCVSITNITLPETVVTVGGGAFNNCLNLTGIVIGHKKNENGLAIGEDAFTKCFKLTDVQIGDVADWCDITFGNADSNPLMQAGKLKIGGETIAELTLPESVTEIKGYAFVNSGITKVTFSGSIKSVGTAAFADCLNLKTQGVYGADEESWCGIQFADAQSNPLFYGEKLYLKGVEIKDLVIPQTVTSVGAFAFYNDVALLSVSIPESVGTVGAYAFSGCANLATITVDLGERPEEWDGDWADFVGTEVKDEKGEEKATEIKWTGKKEVKLDTNTIMAIVVGGILVVVALVLLVMWSIKKIKKRRSSAVKETNETNEEPKETEETPKEPKAE